MPRPISPRWRKFADGLLLGKTLVESYVAAGYRARGKIAEAGAVKVKANSRFQEYFRKRQDQVQERALRTEDEVRAMWEAIAFADITQYLDIRHGSLILKDLAKLPKRLRQCIESIDQDYTKEGLKLRFRLSDRMKALDSLAKMFGMYAPEKHIIDISQDIRTVLSIIDGGAGKLPCDDPNDGIHKCKKH